MKSIIEEYGVFIVEIIAGLLIVGILLFIISDIGLGMIAKMIMNKILGA